MPRMSSTISNEDRGPVVSLFQCGQCGCCENTALSSQGCDGYAERFYDWTGIEDRKGKKLCSVCAPTKYIDGRPTYFGKWHDAFPRVFLPAGLFFTNHEGNLQHRETGSIDFKQYAIDQLPSERVAAPC